MGKWELALKDEGSSKFENKVLEALRPALKANTEHYREKRRARSRPWAFWLAPGLAAAVAIVVWTVRTPAPPTPGAQHRAAPAEIEIAENYELLMDLEEIQSMELMRDLGDPEKWKKKPKKAGRS